VYVLFAGNPNDTGVVPFNEYRYSATGLPPLNPGVNWRVIVWFPAVKLFSIGGEGIVYGVATWIFDANEFPRSLFARKHTEYVWPFTSVLPLASVLMINGWAVLIIV